MSCRDAHHQSLGSVWFQAHTGMFTAARLCPSRPHSTVCNVFLVVTLPLWRRISADSKRFVHCGHGPSPACFASVPPWLYLNFFTQRKISWVCSGGNGTYEDCMNHRWEERFFSSYFQTAIVKILLRKHRKTRLLYCKFRVAEQLGNYTTLFLTAGRYLRLPC
jgi:hypothetical protein